VGIPQRGGGFGVKLPAALNEPANLGGSDPGSHVRRSEGGTRNIFGGKGWKKKKNG